MRLESHTGAPHRVETPLLVALVPAGEAFTELAKLDWVTGGSLNRAVGLGDFRGRERDRVIAYRRGGGGPERVLFAGVGPIEALTCAKVRAAAGMAVRSAEKLRVRSLALCLSFLGPRVDPGWVRAAAEGLVLASWRFDELRSASGVASGSDEAGAGSEKADGKSEEGGGGSEDRPPLAESALVVSAPSASLDSSVRMGQAFAEGENRARTLQARPGNVATPSHLADAAVQIAEEADLQVDVLGPAEMEAQGMGALLAVARGSDEEPRLIVLQHHGGNSGAAPLVLVGKGLTFDAGGISIKPAKGMEDMKYDMSGGAAVLGAMLAIGRLAMPANVVGLVPCSENLLNGSATKPGDVIVSRAGKTIEVINTDAEGRLILADALDYAMGFEPAAIVDCATLTGACVIALGHHRTALLGNDQDLLTELRDAGDKANQPCWPLPLDEEYLGQLRSDVADLKNVGGRPAGTITAACFLSEFVGSTPWAHLDIAGTAYGKTKKPYLRDGPSGRPCRLLLEWVRERAGPLVR